MVSDLDHSPCLCPLARTQIEARSVRSAHTAGAGALLTFKDEDMSTTPSLTPREKNARRYATTLAIIATGGAKLTTKRHTNDRQDSRHSRQRT